MADQRAPSDEHELSPSGRLIRLESGSADGDTARSVRRKRQRMPGLAVLPTALTLGNAVCGVAALIELAKAYAATQTGDPQEVILRLGYATLLIGGGMLFDALDGKVARMTGTAGDFGAQLDSLCDVVTFGVVPALMLRVAGELFYAGGAHAIEPDTNVLWAVAGLYACCAILRLARFNVETTEHDDHKTFMGLPSPAAAASVAAVVLGGLWFIERFEWFHDQPWPWIMRLAFPALGAVIALLMVSRIRYVHLFNRLVSRRQSLRTLVILLVVAAAVFMLIDHWKLLVPVIMLSYVLSGPVYFAYRFIRGRGLLGRRLEVAERKRRRKEGAKKREAAK